MMWPSVYWMCVLCISMIVYTKTVSIGTENTDVSHFVQWTRKTRKKKDEAAAASVIWVLSIVVVVVVHSCSTICNRFFVFFFSLIWVHDRVEAYLNSNAQLFMHRKLNEKKKRDSPEPEIVRIISFNTIEFIYENELCRETQNIWSHTAACKIAMVSNDFRDTFFSNHSLELQHFDWMMSHLIGTTEMQSLIFSILRVLHMKCVALVKYDQMQLVIWIHIGYVIRWDKLIVLFS